jgi:hypothetical protein
VSNEMELAGPSTNGHGSDNGGKTQQEQQAARLLGALREIGGNLQREDALVFEGDRFVLPKQYRADVNGAVSFLRTHIKQQEQEHAFSRKFRYRPFDVAHAFHIVLKDLTGSTGIGKTLHTLFGDIPPEFRSIDVGYGKSAQVPWGHITFPPLQADIQIGATADRELGNLGVIRITCPRKYRSEIEGLFLAIEAYLRDGSIYKGKVITGAEDPGFMDPYAVDGSRLVYSEELQTQLRSNVWGLLEHSQAMRNAGISLKRTVLLEGPYGTGKSEAAMVTAQKAQENGWTFVFCRPQQDDIHTTMRTAMVYAPAVVFIEDIDVMAENGDPEKVTKLLETFDGLSNKGKELIVLLTTNHIEKIQKPMLRPGRMDGILHFGALDRQGYEELVKVLVPAGSLSADTDFDAVCKAMDGFLPAFVKEAVTRAVRYAIALQGGKVGTLTTEALVAAANGLRPQLDLMERASLGKVTPTLDAVVKDLMASSVDGAGIFDSDDDKLYTVKTDEESVNAAHYGQ